jgi:hypothetical protein
MEFAQCQRCGWLIEADSHGGTKFCASCRESRKDWQPLSRRQLGRCSECHKAIAVSATSASPERRRCRDCQRARPKRPKVSPWTPQLVVCRCGTVFEQWRRGQKYCRPEHRPNPPRVNAGSSVRGYGAAHVRARRKALAAFMEGDPCARCGRPMSAEDELHLDHDDRDRSKYLGLSHAFCNLSWAGKRRHAC